MPRGKSRRITRVCPDCGSKNTSKLSKLSPRYVCGDCDKKFAPRALPAQKDRLDRSKSQETRGMKRVGGRKTAASGATRFQKGDGTTSERGDYPMGVRYEFKSTTGKGFRLTLADLQKVQAACEGGEIPAFVVEFVRPGLPPQEFYVLTRNDAEHLLELRDE